ncbi:hypothetical protein L2E82_53080 [Cichorium intybus]|nr:hypothetical protein L2E82_53080 [Cichorium intybus]
MLTLEPFSEDQGRSAVHPARGIPPISFLAPCGFTHPLTRTHVRLLGPVFQDGPNGVPQAGAGSTQVYRRDGACCQPRSTRRHLHEPIDSSGFGRRTNPHRVHAPSRSADRLSPFHIRPGRIAGPHSLPPDNFKHSLTLFSKSFSSFPRGGPGTTGPLTLSGAPFQGTWARSAAEDASPDYNRTARPPDFQAGLIPVRSPVTKGILLMTHDTIRGVFSTTTSRASTEGDSSLGQPHHKHGETNLRPDAMCPIRDAWLGRRDA